MRLTKPLQTLLVALYCCGCWGDDDGATSDAGSGGDANGGFTFPTDISYDNRGTDPVVLGGNCGETWPNLTQDGEPLGIDTSCACSCADFDGSAGCAGCPDICQDTAELAVPGVPITYSWDGLVLHHARPECYTLQAPAKGTTLSAFVCHDIEASDDPQCTQTDFEYGVDIDVTVSATPGPQIAAPQTIVIENGTGESIDVVAERCGGQGWFQLAEPDPRIGLMVFCPCSCNDAFEAETCPDCGGCAEDLIVTLAHGESHSFEWDGRFWYQYASGCARNYAMPQHYAPGAKVCYTKTLDDAHVPICSEPRPLLRGAMTTDTFVVTE